MLARNLLYTGVTRGKRLVVLVGPSLWQSATAVNAAADRSYRMANRPSKPFDRSHRLPSLAFYMIKESSSSYGPVALCSASMRFS